MSEKYSTIRLPDPMIKLIDEYMHEHPEFNSRADFMKQIIREYINKNK